MSLWDYVFEDRKRAAIRAASGNQRRVWRVPGSGTRMHDAAKVDRLSTDWPMTPVNVDAVVKTDLQKLRARSRHEVENNDYAGRFLALLETNVIGETGIRPNPQVRTPDGQPDTPMNDAIRRAWDEWGRSKACDMGGRLTWHEMERLFVRTVAEDGEFVCQEVRGREAGPWGYALNPLDAELLDIQKEHEMERGTYARLGVELNRWHRPVGYWLKDAGVARAASLYLGGYFGDESKLWSAADIIHAFVMKRVGQKRGLPWMSTALFRLRMLSKFEDSAAVVARAGAAQMGAIEREQGDAVPEDDEESEGGPRIIETEPGVFLELRPGEKLHQYTPTYPAEQFEPFVKTILRGSASGVNVGYNTLANDNEKTNYSSMRSSKSDDNDAWRMIQVWTKRSLHDRVYPGWLVMAATTGMLRPVDGRIVSASDAMEMASMVEWDARGWEAIDRVKEVTGQTMEVENALRSRSEIIKARGGNPEQVWQELIEEARLLREAGVLQTTEQTVSRAVREAMIDLLQGGDDDEDEGRPGEED